MVHTQRKQEDKTVLFDWFPWRLDFKQKPICNILIPEWPNRNGYKVKTFFVNPASISPFHALCMKIKVSNHWCLYISGFQNIYILVLHNLSATHLKVLIPISKLTCADCICIGSGNYSIKAQPALAADNWIKTTQSQLEGCCCLLLQAINILFANLPVAQLFHRQGNGAGFGFVLAFVVAPKTLHVE